MPAYVREELLLLTRFQNPGLSRKHWESFSKTLRGMQLLARAFLYSSSFANLLEFYSALYRLALHGGYRLVYPSCVPSPRVHGKLIFYRKYK